MIISSSARRKSPNASASFANESGPYWTHDLRLIHRRVLNPSLDTNEPPAALARLRKKGEHLQRGTRNSLSSSDRPITIATRGSALALAQAHTVLEQCRAAFPKLAFDLKIIKTTGDKLQRASIARPDQSLPKGLFTKELEVALVKRQADLAVHSLKDLPTDLPAGLKLGAVSKRADVRDVFIYRDADWLRHSQASGPLIGPSAQIPQKGGFKPIHALQDFLPTATVAT